jgi:hypothetical protein
MKNRSADATLLGFYYQFDKTIHTILEQVDENNIITIEGIEDVEIKEDGVKLKIIGNADPIGVCGSGILAVVKELVRTGLVRKDGAFIKLKNLEETEPYFYTLQTMVSRIVRHLPEIDNK